MLTKYAESGRRVEVLDAFAVPRNAGRRRLARLRRRAHRHDFTYTPRPGYIYVRSRAISSRCNDNFDEFPAAEIRTAYRTFVGKPVFVNHVNADHRRARGVIIDAALHEDTNPDGTEDTWAEVLMEVDAERFPVLAKHVLSGDIARTSMGTDVEYSVCTVCDNRAATPADYCHHIPTMKGTKVVRPVFGENGVVVGTEEVLVAERCYGLHFFENSLLVEDPADPTAYVLGVDTGDGQGSYSRETNPKVASLAAAVLAEDGVAEASIPRIASVVAPRREDLEYQPRRYDDALARTAARHLAYGEVKAPAKVDTLRTENCPVCGGDESYNGDKCSVCNYATPPKVFGDPDLDKAREIDLRQQTDGSGTLDVTDEEDGAVLECDACGHTEPAAGQAPQEPTGEFSQPFDTPEAPEPTAGPDAPQNDEDDPDAAFLDDDDDDTEDGAEESDDDPDADFLDDDSDEDDSDEGGSENPFDDDDPSDDDLFNDEAAVDQGGQSPEAAPAERPCPACGEGTLRPRATTQTTTEKVDQPTGTDPSARQKEASTAMSKTPNPAQQRRSKVIAALVEQQRVIETQQRTIAGLQRSVAGLQRSVAGLKRSASPSAGDKDVCHADDQPIEFFDGAWYHLKGGPSHNDVYPATPAERAAKESRRRKYAESDQQAAAPAGTDDPTNIGASPVTDVAPAGSDDPEAIGGEVASEAELTGLVNVETTEGGQVSTPIAESDITAAAPSDKPFDENTLSTSSQARYVASLRLARLQIAAGVESGEDLLVAQRIAGSRATDGEIRAQVAALTSVASVAAPVSQQQVRHLVPRRAAASTPAPSLQATASAASADAEWMFGSLD